MPPEEDPRVVDLNRYRRAAAERTRARSRPQPQAASGAPQRLLGRNRLAAPILLAVVLLALVLTVAPALLR